MYKIEKFLKNEYEIGEGPHWDDKSQTLLTVDIPRSDVVRWNPLTREAKRTKLPDASVGAVVPIAESDELLVAAKIRFATVNEESGEVKTLQTIETDEGDIRFNDGKCDPSGRFLAGTMGEETSPGVVIPKLGKLFALNQDLSIRNCLSGVDISNGMAWTADSQKMFFIDSLKFNVAAFDYDIRTGEACNPQTVVTFDRNVDGIPDGMCIDADGNIYIAMFFGSQVLKINPSTGKVLQEIKIENCPKTTSVCFGGPNYDDLYVTSAHNHFNGQNTDKPVGDSGSLFKISGLGVKGTPSRSFIKQI